MRERGERDSGEEVESKGEAVRVEIFAPVLKVGPSGTGFKGNDDRFDAGVERLVELAGGAGATVERHMKTGRDEAFDDSERGGTAREGVEVGDVEGVDAVTDAEGFGDGEGIGGIEIGGAPGLVVRAFATDGPHDPAAEEIEDADPSDVFIHGEMLSRRCVCRCWYWRNFSEDRWMKGIIVKGRYLLDHTTI